MLKKILQLNEIQLNIKRPKTKLSLFDLKKTEKYSPDLVSRSEWSSPRLNMSISR